MATPLRARWSGAGAGGSTGPGTRRRCGGGAIVVVVVVVAAVDDDDAWRGMGVAPAPFGVMAPDGGKSVGNLPGVWAEPNSLMMDMFVAKC